MFSFCNDKAYCFRFVQKKYHLGYVFEDKKGTLQFCNVPIFISFKIDSLYFFFLKILFMP